MFCKKCGIEIGDSLSDLCKKCNPAINQELAKKNMFNSLFSGRIGRVQYLSYSIFATVIALILLKVASVIFDIKFEKNEPLLLGVLFMSPTALVKAKRLRDIGLSGYNAIFVYILEIVSAFVSVLYIFVFVFNLILLFVGGDQEENKYGQPAKSSKSLLWIILLIIIIPILLLVLAPLFA